MLIAFFILVNLGLFLATFVLAKQSESRHPSIGTQIKLEHSKKSKSVTGHMHLRKPVEAENGAPILVLIHGASTSLLDFEPALYPQLAENFSVFSVDRPGHGYSDRFEHLADQTAGSPDSSWVNPNIQASLILEALDKAGIENSIWVGHSLGAAVVLAAMLEFPEKIEAGVIIGGGSHPWTGPPAWHIALSVKPLLGRIFTWQYVETLGRLMLPKALKVVFAPEQAPPGYIDSTGIKLSLRPDTYRHNAVDRSRLSRYLETQSLRYNTIAQPLLSIAATQDGVVPAWNHHDRLQKQISQLQTLKLEGAGHAMHHTRSEEVAEAIISFVNDLKTR